MKARIGTGVVVLLGCVTLLSLKKKKESLLPSFVVSEDTVVKRFEDGGGWEIYSIEDDKAQVSRPDLHMDLAKILNPKVSKHYAIIVGKQGTGKSTAIRRVIKSLELPRGVMYFDCPKNSKLFTKTLSKLIGHEIEVDVSGGFKRRVELTTKNETTLSPESASEESFSELEPYLLGGAINFSAKYDRPIVLVIDSIDILVKKDPRFLGYLQEFAKTCADCGVLRIVFVSSDGTALPLLMATSSWSRAKRPFEIGEISDDEAVSFLVKKDIPVSVASDAVSNLTGGEFAALNSFVEEYQSGGKLQDILRTRNDQTEAVLLQLGLDSGHSMFRQLNTNKRIGLTVALKLGLSILQIESLLKSNILATHPDSKLSFHDRQTEVWFRNKLTVTSA